MKVKGINSSSKKTRSLIKKTFAQLIQEKREIKNITVTELVKKAEITRGTFYSHYDNIYQVASDFQEEIFEACFHDKDSLKEIDNIDEYFDEVINYLKEHENIYKMLLTSDDSLIFMNRLNRKICRELFVALKDNKDKNLELNISFFTDGTINLLIKYFRNSINMSLDEINTYIKKMFKYMFIGNDRIK